MRVVRNKKWIYGMVIGICLLMIILGYYFGCLVNCRYLSVFAAGETDQYKMRSQLLMEAMNQVGVCSAESAASVWANGLKMRSAALQYAMLSKALKEKYALQLEKTAPNWVTGLSSPRIDRFEIVSIKPRDKDFVIKLTFYTKTSTGPAGSYNAVLTISPEGEFYRVVGISADQQLNPYISFSP
ncbi:MAG: hypothetical protein ACOX8Q_01575 [Christensenellales bacterium]|jgi:hypothetical protein